MIGHVLGQTLMSAATPSNPSQNFSELLLASARRYPQKDAILYRGQATTFGDLTTRAAAIASALRQEGIGKGDVCALLGRDPVDAAAGFFAVVGLGATAINLNELYRPRQIEFVLSHSGARLLLISRDILDSLPRTIVATARILVFDDIATGVTELETVAVNPTDPAQITYTSGSTGQPKGVLMSHDNLWAGVRIVSGYLGLTAEDRIASLLPFSFVYGFNQLTTSLYVGATLVVERSTLAQEIVTALRRERVTVLAGVPPLWQQLLGTSPFRERSIETLRIVTNAGGRLPPATVRELRAAQPQAKLFLMYGLTEVFRSTFLPPEEVDEHPDSMGRAIPESEVYVVTEAGDIARPGEVGELVHGGPTVGVGYLGDAEATQRVFKPNPFFREGAPPRVVYSGDLVRRDESGRLYYVSRRDRMIKTMGFRVSPDEICDVIQASGLVTEAAVITEPDSQRGEKIIACVVMRDSSAKEQLRRFCGVELPRYMQPVEYHTLEAIPRNASGKHDLHELRARVASTRSAAPAG